MNGVEPPSKSIVGELLIVRSLFDWGGISEDHGDGRPDCG